MADQYPIAIILSPFFTAFAVFLLGSWKEDLCRPLVFLALLVSVMAGLGTLWEVIGAGGELVYYLGDWPRPIGIEYRLDFLNALLVVVISVVALLTAVYSREPVKRETPDKIPHFYALYLLLVTGLLGISLTGDAFNLYVLLEVTSLTSYALIAMGSKRALVASFNYIIMGTIGASFYLLGVGYLYIKTGSLNMVDISEVLLRDHLYGSESVLIAFMIILIGVWIKMAFFPLHGWLPNAYAYAPTTTGCLIAPLMTKVTVYVMIRIIFTVFQAGYVFAYLDWSRIVVTLAVITIIAGSGLALAQSDLRKMLAYIIVTEVGYMVGGVWLANETGLIGAVYHIISDAFMTLCLFFAAGVMIAKSGNSRISGLKGLFGKMPFTMAAFTVGGLSIIGVPPTCGFFSKWYLLRGGIEAGAWAYVAALLFSSLVNAVIFFRVFEVAWLGDLTAAKHAPSEEAERGKAAPKGRIEEAPFSMLAPLLLSAVFLFAIGVFNEEFIALISQTVHPFWAPLSPG